MFDTQDDHQTLALINFVDDSVVSHADAPPVPLAAQLGYASRAGSALKSV